jgi:hypothetical protein
MRAACHILTCSLLAWCAAVPTATAGQLDDLATAKSLTDADKQLIRSTVESGLKQLGSRDVDAVTTARAELSGWADERATPVFRGEFSKSACGPLADLVLRAEPIQAVNAIEVLRVVQTHEALQHLAKLANSATVTNVGVRLAAARALQAAIEAGTDMNSAQADGLVRAITDASKRESEWACSYSQLTALSAIAKRSGMDAKVVSAARAGQVSGLGAIAAKVGKSDAKDAQLMKSASRVLAAMRKDLANAPAAERSAVAGTLLPVIESLRKAGAAPPAGLDADVTAAYADTVRAADLMAELLKASGKPATKPAGKPAAKPAPKKPAN